MTDYEDCQSSLKLVKFFSSVGYASSLLSENAKDSDFFTSKYLQASVLQKQGEHEIFSSKNLNPRDLVRILNQNLARAKSEGAKLSLEFSKILQLANWVFVEENETKRA